MKPSRHFRRIGYLVLVAACLTLGQVVLATMSARGNTWTERYRSLWIWDGGWYADIVDHGYRAVSPSGAGSQYNLAFFPGYPVVAGIVKRCLNLSTGVALLLTSQVSAFVFWLFLLLLLERWRVPRSAIAAVVMLMFCQPGAYYFVVTYSEPLFFAGFLGFLFFGPEAARGWVALAVGCVAAYIMSATRILGAPLAMLPLFWAYNHLRAAGKAAWSRAAMVVPLSKYAILAFFTAFGTISYFIFCAVYFGHWNEYMRAGAIGWAGNHADSSTILAPHRYRLRMPRFAEEFISAPDITRLYIPLLSLFFVVVIGGDAWLSFRRRLPGFSERLPLYLAAVALFLVCASAGTNAFETNPVGFIRYGLYSTVPMFLALAHAYRSSQWRDRELPLGVQLAVFVISTLGLAAQLQLCWRYARAVFIA